MCGFGSRVRACFDILLYGNSVSAPLEHPLSVHLARGPPHTSPPPPTPTHPHPTPPPIPPTPPPPHTPPHAEQGEMVQAKFGVPSVALRQLEVFCNSVLLATLQARRPLLAVPWSRCGSVGTRRPIQGRAAVAAIMPAARRAAPLLSWAKTTRSNWNRPFTRPFSCLSFSLACAAAAPCQGGLVAAAHGGDERGQLQG